VKSPWILFLLSVLLAGGCTVKTPEVSFTSERTALERQILGSYRTIQEDAWMVASARTAPGPQPEDETAPVILPENRRQALEAYAGRRFNADDVEEFKLDGVAGEDLRGLLVIRSTDRYREEPDYRRRVDRIMAEENRDREIIMARIVEVHSATQAVDPAAVARVFAQMNRDASPPGTWIQAEDQSWIRK